MLGDITAAKEIYIACGYTDMRKSIDGLAALVQETFGIDPFASSLYLFCGKRRNRIKALLWEGDGFVLLYKRLENGNFKWPRSADQVRSLTWQEFKWLMEGLEIDQPRAIKKVKPGAFC
ncbi:IS66 family insertion sequence element accessory protein TnpB [Dehalobacter restrictus]|jgi:transposase|uniref:Transposase IS66 n=2 Tax=Dehalobacter TaxID=56112 RepID=A0ABM5P859_DEHRP|nr:IS66 family insertion sequence element accessory protein TnpB [Dehalobacter restrictus]AHF10480.1 transposase IS66 [Dehalobacter restrictus DSM 9455]AHF10896.1 transposase IS66 [Dehalobacter restrictus DSM 9455]